ncbi:uncharacterized protein LOC143214928 [Lasioglossum baleicum]|uniref:uncharacterized protein LOC143214928 n=1 Tax=Lasioglossum baleicum TaxID=434251 RepID=UPI003FCCE3B5
MSSPSFCEVVRQKSRRKKMGDKKIYRSTPVKGAPEPQVISDSSINTNSSTNISRRLLTPPVKAEKKQKPTRAKKEMKPAKAKKKTKPAEKKTEAGINRKKRKPKKLVYSDSEWLTTAEQTDDEKENLEQSVRSPTKRFALFEDAPSPELVREAQAIHDYHFESPVRQRRKYALSPVRVDLGDGEKTLPVKDLPHLRTVFDSSDEEEELLPRRRDPVRTYPGVAHRRKKKAEINIDKPKRWIVDVKIHTASADMLWDEYVREHPEEMREYIAPPAERQKARFSHLKSMDSNKSDKGEATKKEDWRTQKISIGPDNPKHTYIARGHCDRILRKVVRKIIVKDPFEFPGPKDAAVKNLSYSEYKRIIANAKNIKITEEEKFQRSKPVESALSTEFQRHHDFRSYATRKYNVEPYEFPEPKDAELEICSTGDSDLHQAGPSCSKNERITKKYAKNIKITEEEKFQRSKPVESALSTEFQRHHDFRSYATRKYNVEPYEFPEHKDAELEICSTGDSDLHQAGPSCSKNERITKKYAKNIKITEEEKFQRSKPVESALFKEIRRYSNVCSYATRLKAKGQEMLSENVAKNSNEKSLVSAQRTTRKRASEVNRDDSKRANIAVDKPTIRTVRDLDGKRYVKEKDNWRII